MKALVLFSGGLDSTTCLAMAVKEYGNDNVIALSVSYGQKHIKEIEAAKNVVKYYNVRLIEINLLEIFKDSKCTLLNGRDDIPTDSYEKQIKESKDGIVSTYVPFRNGLFLSAAASVAISNECDVIYYGIHMDDSFAAYPDCTNEFNEAIKNAIYLGSGKKVKVYAPFVNKEKKDVVKKGLFLNVPYELTWSCYNGHEKPCGVCGTCIDRINAFKANGVEDPLEYEVK